jgi:ribonuclease T2
MVFAEMLTGDVSSLVQVQSGGKLLLASSGSTAWTSDKTPSGTTQETVFTGNSHAQDFTIAIVAA